MARLIVQFSGKTVSTHELDKSELVIGREPDCDISIENLAISRRHCKVTKKDSIYSVTDMNSNNGTYVNGRKVTTYNLNDRDEIILGKYLIIFEDEEARNRPQSADAIPALADGPHTMAVDSNKLDQLVRSRATLKRARLASKSPDGHDITIPLAKPIIMIGSLPSCDWKISGFTVAKRQALIYTDAQGYRIVNLGNWAKTYVNGSPVEEALLRTNDEIKIGKYYAKFFEEE